MHLDTSFLIDLQKEHSRETSGVAHAFLQKHPDIKFCTSAVAAMEYLEGFADNDVESGTGFLKLFDLVDVGLGVALQGSRIRRSLRAQGQLLPDADILIAACAMFHDAPLVTDNQEHFSRISGLKIIGYRDAVR